MTCGYGSDFDFSIVVRKGLIVIMLVAGLIFTCWVHAQLLIYLQGWILSTIYMQVTKGIYNNGDALLSIESCILNYLIETYTICWDDNP